MTEAFVQKVKRLLEGTFTPAVGNERSQQWLPQAFGVRYYTPTSDHSLAELLEGLDEATQQEREVNDAIVSKLEKELKDLPDLRALIKALEDERAEDKSTIGSLRDEMAKLIPKRGRPKKPTIVNIDALMPPPLPPVSPPPLP